MVPKRMYAITMRSAQIELILIISAADKAARTNIVVITAAHR